MLVCLSVCLLAFVSSLVNESAGVFQIGGFSVHEGKRREGKGKEMKRREGYGLVKGKEGEKRKRQERNRK